MNEYEVEIILRRFEGKPDEQPKEVTLFKKLSQVLTREELYDLFYSAGIEAGEALDKDKA